MVNLTSVLNPSVLNPSVIVGLSVFLSSALHPTIALAHPTENTVPGQNGRSGESKTIYLSKPEVMQLDLSGADGQAGENFGSIIGSTRPRHRHDRKKDHQNHHKDDHTVGQTNAVTMANGSAGRNGGNGGNGGDGGSLTVYYQNLSDLNAIQVTAKPGRGAVGGSGELGSPGEKCPHHHQKNQKKEDEKKAPSCTDGTRGADGRTGASGRDGKLGQLFLIQGQQPIAGDSPSLRNSLRTFLQAPQALSLNRWDEQSGALRLLSQGSVIDDQYQEYRDRLEKTAKLTWNAKTEASEYSGQPAKLSLQRNGTIDVAFEDSQLWTVVEQSERPVNPTERPTEKPITLVAITSMIHQREVTQLTPGITDKRDRAFTLNVIDTAGKSDIVETQFSVRVRSIGSNGRWGGFSNSTTQYEGAVPANLVTRDYNRFVLNLGGLPVDADVFKAGAELEVEITATRSLGSRSTQKTIDWSGTVY